MVSGLAYVLISLLHRPQMIALLEYFHHMYLQ